MEEQYDEEASEEFARFLHNAVAEILRTEDAEAFFAWMRENGPAQAPELFGELPDDESRRSYAGIFGRSLWNAIPLPGNGFRPRPLPWPERNDPCPCGSGSKYKKCCAEWASEMPELDPEAVWRLTVDELSLEQTEALGASGRVPRSVVGDLATALLDDGDADRALALVLPLFDRPEKLDERDAAALNTLLEAYDNLELEDEKQEAVERLSKVLRPVLRGVLWENLVRSHAVAGEMEEAWETLEKARKDNPKSPALGPLEVSLLLAEGKMAEAGERARYWRDRLRDSDLTEEGFKFLDRVAADPEKAQTEFALGDEVSVRLRKLEEVLARTKPKVEYEVQDSTEEPGTLLLVPSPALVEIEEGWVEIFDPQPEMWTAENLDRELEDWDSWDEENAEDWLGFLLDHPDALDSLLVLDEVADALSELAEDLPSVADSLLQYVLDRGTAILDGALAGRPEPRLERHPETNDSAVSLLTKGMFRAQRRGDLEAAKAFDRRRRSLDPENPAWEDEPPIE
ncbi:MAG TPA: SEC-C metal-binding domain-containing protein [Thermoanaerobaculia bacterium]